MRYGWNVEFVERPAGLAGRLPSWLAPGKDGAALKPSRHKQNRALFRTVRFHLDGLLQGGIALGA